VEKNVILDQASSTAARGGSATKHFRWPSLLSLFSTSTTTWRPSQPHHPAPSNRLLSTSRQFHSDVNVSDRKQYGGPTMTSPAVNPTNREQCSGRVMTSANRKQYGGAVMSSPKVEVGRPLSSMSRPAGLVAVDIPLLEDITQAASTTNAVDEGCFRCRKTTPILTYTLLLCGRPGRTNYRSCPSASRSVCPSVSLSRMGF